MHSRVNDLSNHLFQGESYRRLNQVIKAKLDEVNLVNNSLDFVIKLLT